MRFFLAVTLVFLGLHTGTAQEKPVPKDSTRITVPGCVAGRVFTVMQRQDVEPVTAEVPPGRHFRLNGKKDLLKEMNAHKESMVQVTGLVRTSQLRESGIGVAGGRVRIGGGSPQAPMGGGVVSPTTYDVAGFDVESWRPLPDPCPSK